MNEITIEESIKEILDFAKKNYEKEQDNINLAIDLARKSNNL